MPPLMSAPGSLPGHHPSASSFTSMPLTLTLSEGVLPSGSEALAVSRICDSFLKWHGLSGNKVLTPNVLASVHIIPTALTFSGGTPGPIAVIEWRTPSFAFSSREAQQGHLAEAVEILHEASGGRHPKDRIWGSVVHAVDGTWIVGGSALTNAELGQAISQG